MEKRKSNSIKIIFSILFAVAILGGFGYILWKGDLSIEGFPNVLFFGCVALCFLFSLIFVRNNLKKFCITFALGLEVLYVFFTLVKPDVLTTSDPNLTLNLITYVPLGIACGVQFFFFVYSASLSKGKGKKIINVAVRVGLCLLVWFLLPKVLPQGVTLSTYQLIDLMRLVNALITFLSLFVHLGSEWLAFLGFLALFVMDVWFWLMTTGPMLFEVAPGILADMLKYYYQYVIYCQIPALFLLSLSSVWAKKKEKKS